MIPGYTQNHSLWNQYKISSWQLGCPSGHPRVNLNHLVHILWYSKSLDTWIAILSFDTYLLFRIVPRWFRMSSRTSESVWHIKYHPLSWIMLDKPRIPFDKRTCRADPRDMHDTPEESSIIDWSWFWMVILKDDAT